MNIQPKPRVLALPLGRGARKQPADADGSSTMAGSSLQSLAAELHQSAVQGVFEYSQNLMSTVKVAVALLTVMPFLVLAMLIIPAVQAEGAVAALVSWKVLAGLIAGTVAVLAAGFISVLLPAIQVRPEGIAVSGIFMKRRVPWKQVGTLRVMELTSPERYVVMIPFEGNVARAPLADRLLVFVGAAQKGEKGVLITSDIKNFDRLLQLIVAYMSQAAGQIVPAIEAFVDEESVMPRAQLIFDVNAALSRLAKSSENDVDRYGIQRVDDGPPLVWPQVISRQLLIAAAPALFMFVSMLTRSDQREVAQGIEIWLLLMMAFGVLELPFIAKLSQSVGDMTVGVGQFRRSVTAYEELQVPRALLIMAGVALLGTGIPSHLAQGLWVVGMFVTAYLATRFVQRLYDIALVPALMVSVGTLVFQATLFALYFGLR